MIVDNWKEQQISKIEDDIKYHRDKITDLERKLAVYRAFKDEFIHSKEWDE